MTKTDPVLEAIGGRGRYQFFVYFLTIFASFSASFQLLNIVFVGKDTVVGYLENSEVFDRDVTVKTEMTKTDPVLEAIGGRGRYQFFVYFLTIFASFSASFQRLNIVFVGRKVPHVCKQPANLSDVFDAINNDFIDPNNSVVYFDKCKIRVEANVSGNLHTSDLPCLYGYQYEEKQDTSIMSDMNVVCEDENLQSLGQTLLIMGQGIGSLFLTPFSDRFGRRTILVFSHAIFLVIGVVIAFAPNFTTFLVLRVFLGIFQQGIVLGYCTIAIEVFSTPHRKFAGLINNYVWSFCGGFIPLVAYLMQDYSWRYTQLAYCSVSLYVIVQFLFMDESLSWLITNRRAKQVKKILKKAARMSGKDDETVLQVYRDYQEREDKGFLDFEHKSDHKKTTAHRTEEGTKGGEKQKDPHKPSFVDLMKRKRLALNVFVIWFIWITDSTTYFGLYMTAHTLAGDRYINVLLLALVDIPSNLIFFFMIDRYGRKKTSMTLHGIAAFGLITATILNSVGNGSHWSDIAVIVFSCIGMSGASAAWNVSFFFTPEMFPTNLRNFGLGTSSAFSRLGGMVAPYSSLLVEYVPWGPGAIFGGCCFLVTILVNFLPETMGRELPQTLDDMEAWYKKGSKERSYEVNSAETKDEMALKSDFAVLSTYKKF